MAHSLILNHARHITLSSQDRAQHVLVSGLPSTGVTTFLIDLIMQDIANDTPVFVFDPYGDIANRILSLLSAKQLADTAYIDIGNAAFPVGINLFEADTDEDRREVVNSVVDMLYELYDPGRTGIIGPRFEHAVRNAILTIMYDKGSTFTELVRCLTDQAYVEKLLPKITDPFVKNYWTKQIAQTSDFHKSEVLDYIVSKFSKFVVDKKIRNIVGQSVSTLNFSQILANKKIILLDMSAVRGDYEATRILQEMLLLKLTKTLRDRKNKEAVSFYVDEVLDYPSHRVKELLRSGRREGISLICTTQQISEIDIFLRKELLKAGTLISFRQSTDNASILAPEFHTKSVNVDQLCMLKRFHMAVKTLQQGNPVINEEVSTEQAFSNREGKDQQEIEKIKVAQRKQYGKDVREVEKEIAIRME